jgi:hypothetical protein
MHDADIGLRCDPNVEMQQVIVIFVDRPGEGILHRYHRRVDLSGAQRYENGFKCRDRAQLGPRAQQLARRFLAKSPQFALDPRALRFHRSYPGFAYRRTIVRLTLLWPLPVIFLKTDLKAHSGCLSNNDKPL